MSKLYVFDLDNTLYLWNVDEDYKRDYECKLINFLDKLKSENIILTIASHNRTPRHYLRKMSICSYFDYIIGEHPRNKYTMILEILKNVNETIKKENIVFFDDSDYNIKDCETNGIKSIKIDPNIGINFEITY